MTQERNASRPLQTFEQIAQRAVENLLQDGSHVPALLIDGSHQDAIFVLTDLASNHETRLAQFFILGAAVAMDESLGQVRQIFLIAEAWLSKMQGPQASLVRPTQDPNRMEVLVVSSAEVSSKQMRVATYEMVRDDQGILREVKEHVAGNGDSATGQSSLLDAFIAGFQTRSR